MLYAASNAAGNNSDFKIRLIMTDQSESEVEVDPYSTPVASRASSPLPHDKNESSMNSSESEVVSTSIMACLIP